MSPERVNCMDHVVLVIFENRSFDNLLGHLYNPDQMEAFEGVVGRDLSNPIPAWAEHGAEGGVVPYAIAASMDSPDPDPGEEYQHTNTQLFNVLDRANRFKDATEMVPPYNAPPAGQQPTMDGFVTDYISFLNVELRRQPVYDQYRQIMTGYTPDQVPVLSALARGFGVFDHWFSEVPSQTMANRSFWTAATSSGFVVNRPMTNFMRHNRAETIFDRLEQHGKTWKVYVLEPDPISFTGFIHMERLRERFATNFVPFAEFERDAAEGTLPDFSLIEPNLLAGHCDYHPAFGRALLAGVDVLMDPPSSISAGEAFLGRIYDAIRTADSTAGSNVFNCSSSASTSQVAPTTTCLRGRCRPRSPVIHRDSSGSPLIAPAIGSRRSSCRPGSRRAPCTRRSTGTRRCWRPCARCGISGRPSRRVTRRLAASTTSFVWTRPGLPARGPRSPHCRCPPTKRSGSRPARH